MFKLNTEYTLLILFYECACFSKYLVASPCIGVTMLTKAKLVPVITAIAFASAVLTAFALPTLNVYVQKIGVGVAHIDKPASVASIRYVFTMINSTMYLTAVEISFDSTLENGTYIRVEFRDSNNTVIAFGEKTLDEEVNTSTWIYIELNRPLKYEEIKEIEQIAVMVLGPSVEI